MGVGNSYLPRGGDYMAKGKPSKGTKKDRRLKRNKKRKK